MDRTSLAVALVSPDPDLKDGLARTLIRADYRVHAPPPEAALLDTLPGADPIVVLADVHGNFLFTLHQLVQFKDRHPVSWIALLTAENRIDDLVRAFRCIHDPFSTTVVTCETLADSVALALLAPEHLRPGYFALLYPHAGTETGELLQSRALAAAMRYRSPGSLRGWSDRADPHSRIAKKDEGDGGSISSEPIGRPLLSARQTFILKCLLQGESNKAIAQRIRVTEGTVKIHIQRLLRRLGVRNRTEAAVWALGRRWDR
ncbi:response regulator transcription factor [Bradyrhizobium sp. STM 3557]|uniref:response regulator transcription factor n=1 Tax=Bradyrhizobium sp. STM 3557 TaxID=578920 RepID=UPI00388FEBBC